MIFSLFDVVAFTTGRFVLSCLALCFRVLFFSTVKHSDHLAWDEMAGLCASRAFVCLCCTHQFLFFFSSS